MTGTLVLCHPDTIQVIQSSNAPKGLMYRFVRPFIGEHEFTIAINLKVIVCLTARVVLSAGDALHPQKETCRVLFSTSYSQYNNGNKH